MYTLIFLLLAVFCLYIGIWSFIKWDSSWLRNLDTLPVRFLLILAGVILLLAAFLLIRRLLKNLEEKNLRRLAVLCILILAAGQLIFLFVFRPMLRYDPLKTFDMAVEMLQTRTISGTYETGYFARYTNNYPITILTYWFLLLLSKCKAAESFFMPAVQLINIACITGSIWLGFRITEKTSGLRTGVFYLVLCVLCPLSYVWAGYFYTNTCSMPCLMGILYLYLELPKSRTRLWQGLSGGALGLILVLGYKLRATTMIAMIAVGLAAFLKLWKQAGSAGSPRQAVISLAGTAWKYAVSLTAFLLAVILSLGFWHSVTNRYVDFDYQNTGFPVIHWIMMGSRWDGAFEQLDELYTSGFATKEEKIAADKQVLLERLEEAGPAGLIALAGRKLLNTWADGTDSYLPENSYSVHGKLYDYLLGNKCGFAAVYAQIFRALQMLSAGLAALAALWRWRTRKELSGSFLIQLTLLGAMAFHLIWETNPLYSIPFTFLGLILLADSVSLLLESTALRPVLKRSWLGCTAAWVLLSVLLVFSKKELVDTPIEERSYSVDQYQYAGGSDGYVTDYDQIYKQTFTTSRPFNRIAIRAVNTVGPYNQSAFLVKLTREDGTVLYDNDRFLSGMVEKNKPYEFLLDMVVPDGPTSYTLEITPGYIKGEDSLEFLSYNTGNCDMYPGGSLTVGAQEQKKGDLAFAVCEYKVTTYFSIKAYAVLCAGILMLAGSIVFLTRKAWKAFPPN